MSEATENDEETVSAVWPDDVFAAFLRAVPPRDLWGWLRQDEQFALLHEIARGFQQSPKALSQPLVRSRLKAHLEREPAVRDALQNWWRENAGKAVCDAIALIENDEMWREKSSQMREQSGRDNLLLATLFDARFSLPEDEKTGAPTSNRVLDAGEKAFSNKASTDLDTQIAHLKIESEAFKVRAQIAESSAQASRRESEKLQTENKRFKSESERQKHLLGKRDSDLQNRITEAQKLVEREARRARQLEKQAEEQSVEIKRLKRLVRQTQLLQEGSRRQIAQLQAQIEELQPAKPVFAVEVAPTVSEKIAKPPKPPRAPKPLFGRDEVFSGKTEGREWRVSPRGIKEKIDRNDEVFVANLARHIEVLHQENPELAKRFRSSVRQLGRYYNRVLDGATTRVLVDASNVARYEKDGRNRGQLRHLLSMRDELRRYDCFPILFFADASLPHNIDEPDELKAMARRGELEIVVAGTEADDVLAREARKSGANVVTNDRNFHGRVAPDWEPSRIGFHIRDGIVVLEGLD